MFFAVHSTTGEKVNSLTIEQNPSYQFIHDDVWYADSDEIESAPPGIDVKTIKVFFREGSRDVINYNGTKYSVSPCFFIPNKTALGINTIPESKEHKLAKNWIYNKIKSGILEISYSSINKPYKYDNTSNLLTLSIDNSKIGIETTSSVSGQVCRRADVICPFLKTDSLLGNGIVFEIQFTDQREGTKRSRELDWAIRGYSVAWIYPSDFNYIDELFIEMKNKVIRVDSFAHLIKENAKSHIRELKYATQECCRQLDSKKMIVDEYCREAILRTEFKIGESVRRLNNIINDKNFIDKITSNVIGEQKKNETRKCPKCGFEVYSAMSAKTGKPFWLCRKCGVFA
jgi:predicted RNA-binding Zn-ribbon protein involved in translation (DUF1610 family)